MDAVINSLVDHAIFTLDTDGNITSWNTAAEKTKGYTEAEIIGQHFSRFYTAEDRALDLPGLALRMAVEKGRHEAEGWRVRKDADLFWANVVIQPLADRRGKIEGFVKVTRDITQNLQVENLREELHQSQKLEMVGQLTGGVAHDFNNLLTAIGATHDLVRKYANDARVDRIMEVNKTALDRSRKLISQLLAFSRKQLLYPQTCSLNDLIVVFDVLLHKAVGETVIFCLDLQPDLPPACIDQGQFQSALLNLVVNARDAMPAGGELKVFTDRVSLTEANYPPPYDVPAGDYIVLGVGDTGRGMSPHVRAKAFEPFFTTKEPGAGTGLGLSQCYGFARQSGGTLVIESQEGQGTTVRLLLPAMARSVDVAPQPSNRTILFVDDDLTVRVLVAEILRDMGHTVIEAEDAQDALHQLHNDVSIDFLFTDIIMPNGMDGLRLIAAARDIRPGLRALLASGYPRDVLRDLARLPDDVVYLAKPYSRSDLAANFGAYPPAPEGGAPPSPPDCE